MSITYFLQPDGIVRGFKTVNCVPLYEGPDGVFSETVPAGWDSSKETPEFSKKALVDYSSTNILAGDNTPLNLPQTMGVSALTVTAWSGEAVIKSALGGEITVRSTHERSVTISGDGERGLIVDTTIVPDGDITVMWTTST